MIKSNKLHAYAVAAQFGDAQQGFLACCPYVASDPAVAAAQVVALIIGESKTTLPLIAVNATPLPVEWLRGALEHIDASEKAEEAEKPRVVQLVSDNLRFSDEWVDVPDAVSDRGSVHSLSCPKRWGGWGHCRCGAEHGDGAA